MRNVDLISRGRIRLGPQRFVPFPPDYEGGQCGTLDMGQPAALRDGGGDSLAADCEEVAVGPDGGGRWLVETIAGDAAAGAAVREVVVLGYGVLPDSYGI